jgi:hypothetical protein
MAAVQHQFHARSSIFATAAPTEREEQTFERFSAVVGEISAAVAAAALPINQNFNSLIAARHSLCTSKDNNGDTQSPRAVIRESRRKI